jgi:hypothetical protein
MDMFREGILRTADELSLAVQNAGKTFGLLADGRELVVVTDRSDSTVATFPDHSDEGWPAATVPLPSGSKFAYAASGFLTRVARWKVQRSASQVCDELTTRDEALVLRPRPGGIWVAALASGGVLRIKEPTPGVTLLSFEQARNPEAIRRPRAAVRRVAEL